MSTADLFNFDKEFKNKVIAGVDEAGRGPLAGPVVCATCVMPMNGEFIDRINDSKKVTPKIREALYEIICREALDYCIVEADNNMIDAVNILNATRYAMQKSVEGLKKVTPSLVLVDAVNNLNLSVEYLSIIKGDEKSYNIAASSILAKVHRDRLMLEYDRIYPQYNFKSNKGYGTSEHIQALKKYGKTDIHRLSFIGNFITIEEKINA